MVMVSDTGLTILYSRSG